MYRVEVRYFLQPEGVVYFPHWCDEVFKASSQQEGFLEMRYEQTGASFVVYLDFESEEKLRRWANTEEHDLLAAKIEDYFIKPKSVSRITSEKNETGDA